MRALVVGLIVTVFSHSLLFIGRASFATEPEAATESSTIFDAEPIVFTRTRRSVGTYHLGTGEIGCAPIARDGGESECVDGIDIFDDLTEVFAPEGNWPGPGQLVLQESDGDLHVLFDCTKTYEPVGNDRPVFGEPVCTPVDPTVSFDKRRIWFSVLHGTFEYNRVNSNGRLPVWCVASRTKCDPGGTISPTAFARIHMIDLSPLVDDPNCEGGEGVCWHTTPWPQPPGGTFQTAPVLTANDEVMFVRFAKNDEHAYPVMRGSGISFSGRLWLAKQDGSNQRPIGPHHAFGGALHPVGLPSGYIMYSFNHAYGLFPHASTNGPNPHGNTSPYNAYGVARVLWDGSDWNALLGFHQPLTKSGTDILSLHLGGPLDNSKCAMMSYYRRGSYGGRTLYWDCQPPGVEGHHPERKVRGVAWLPGEFNSISGSDNVKGTAASWEVATEAPSICWDKRLRKKISGALCTGADREYLGKTRTPHASGPDEFVITLGRGPCSSIENPKSLKNLQTRSTSPRWGGCHWSIVKARVSALPIAHPSDFEVVYEDPHWQAWDARPWKTYTEIFGKSRPAKPEPSNSGESGACYFQTANARLNETTFAGYYPLNSKRPDYSKYTKRYYNSSAPPSIGGAELFSPKQSFEVSRGRPTRDDVVAIRFWRLVPRKRSYGVLIPPGDNSGRARKAPTNLSMRMAWLGDAPITNGDGSLKVRIPCERPIIHAGVNADGFTVMRSQVAESYRDSQTSRGGEARTCKGCHLHSIEYQPNAPAFEESIAAARPPVDLTVGASNRMISFNVDVYPILQKRCVSCHSTGQNEPYMDKPGLGPWGALDPNSRLTNHDTAVTLWRLAYDAFQWANPNALAATTYFNHVPTEFSSAYVNRLYAIKSPLLWAAYNQRLDGYNDDETPWPQFVPRIEHDPARTGITQLEASIIAAWLDQAAQDDVAILDSRSPTPPVPEVIAP